jgi:MoxR-like ATPase
VPNLLYAERITILAGEAGVGKTTFALEIADALTRTGNLWGGTVEVQRGRVLWLDFDHDWGRLQEIVDAYYGECEREIYTIPREQLVPLEPTTLPLYRRAIEQLRNRPHNRRHRL